MLSHTEAQCPGEYPAILVDCHHSDSRWGRWPWLKQGKGNGVKGPVGNSLCAAGAILL